ncbi:C-type lectin domain family 12 member B-like isoform X1 [Apus apus]|uniref:C-type lectin domain family 12 member B-like isoform X1 n=1 Tax=Apus apus TaxID=8895 RepID=UPI0021F823AB|nr:C-type lectin domain family 12 member B-like isoform X1 [Apus apus]
MTEEITYANLKFGNSHALHNITEPEDTKEKGPPTSSCSCQPVVLILSIMCLALLMVLVILAVFFFQIPKDYMTQLRDLNMTKNELHANFSNMLQAIGNQLCLEGEKSLKNNGQKCVLCPVNWKWDGGDTCYYHAQEQKTWQQSRKFCQEQNSTLLLMKEAAKQELVKKFPVKTYWLGLIFRPDRRDWYWADNTTLTEEQKYHLKDRNFPEDCGYSYEATIYVTSCKRSFNYICEKPAIQLQRGNNHWQEDWFVRPK